MSQHLDIRHFHLFCGSGGGALGFNQGHARVGTMQTRFRCIGGVDVDAVAIKDFTRFAGVPGTVLDLFDAVQYAAFHDQPPPAGWRPAGPDDIRRAAGGEHPHIVFLSAPCKGFSGLLNGVAAASPKYQALNGLALRGVQLMLDAFGDDPPALVIFENVPRIAQRGRALLDDITHELELAGYAVAETTHDCGELGGLAQHRRRFLLVARHRAKVPPFLYEPPRQRVRAVGEVLGAMPLPDEPAAGPMHRSPRLEWRTWVRLALIPAGGDWRSLEGRDFSRTGIVPWHRGVLGVTGWDATASTVTGNARPATGRFAVGDPRPPVGVIDRDGHVYGVTDWHQSAETITAKAAAGSGRFSVGDPRVGSYGEHAKLRVEGWEKPCHTVTGSNRVGSGALSVADPRPFADGDRPDPVPHIIALDGTWHRPFTTLELAALQGYPWELLLTQPFCGRGDTTWREHIGNSVPPPTAAAIASAMGHALLLARTGTGFQLSASPIWVRRLACALSVSP